MMNFQSNYSEFLYNSGSTSVLTAVKLEKRMETRRTNRRVSVILWVQVISDFFFSCVLQALFKAEDEQDACAATRAKAEQAAELAEFDEGIPLSEDGKVSFKEFRWVS